MTEPDSTTVDPAAVPADPAPAPDAVPAPDLGGGTPESVTATDPQIPADPGAQQPGDPGVETPLSPPEEVVDGVVAPIEDNIPEGATRVGAILAPDPLPVEQGEQISEQAAAVLASMDEVKRVEL